MNTKRVFDVEIVRVHKSSPYRCDDYIPNIKANDTDEAIKLPEIVKAICNTFGKKLIVRFYPIYKNGIGMCTEYSVSKSRAIMQ